MKRKKIFKIAAILILSGILIGGGVGYYLFNMPHRDVQESDADYKFSSKEIVDEYLTNYDGANQKYLAADGDSKILEISGTVDKISEDFNGNKVILLKEVSDKAGVRVTFTAETNNNASVIETGQSITVKGVIRSGASYDEDLELYENVILEKADVVTN